jgi:hypothetical protein
MKNRAVLLDSDKSRLLKVFAQQRVDLIEALRNFELKLNVFNHTNTKTTEGMDTIIIIQSPDYLNHVLPGAWKCWRI